MEKARLVDLLSRRFDVVVRYQGGGDRQKLHEIIRRCSMEAFPKKPAPLLESVTEQGEDVAL